MGKEEFKEKLKKVKLKKILDKFQREEDRKRIIKEGRQFYFIEGILLFLSLFLHTFL